MARGDSNSRTRLFVAYVEAVIGSGPDRQRVQYIAFPPLTGDNVPENTRQQWPDMLLFYRQQRTPADKTVWKRTFMAPELVRSRLVNAVGVGYASWRWSPVIVCEVAPHELAELYALPKTPYRILERLGKVARRNHDYTI